MALAEREPERRRAYLQRIRADGSGCERVRVQLGWSYAPIVRLAYLAEGEGDVLATAPTFLGISLLAARAPSSHGVRPAISMNVTDLWLLAGSSGT